VKLKYGKSGFLVKDSTDFPYFNKGEFMKILRE